jgi:hypothetical protein
MEKLKIVLKVMLVLCIGFIIPMESVALAKEQYSEKKLDKLLIKNGVPKEYLSDMVYEEKVSIIGDLGENFTYEGRTVEEYYVDKENNLVKIDRTKGDVSTLGTIPTTDLKLWFDVYNGSFNGKDGKSVYAKFQWNKYGVEVNNDRMGMSVDEGWYIIPDTYRCGVSRRASAEGSTASFKYYNDCGGRPGDIGFSGASWNFTGDGVSGKGVWNWQYMGWTNFFMQKKSSTANHKVVMKYIQDKSWLNGASFSVSWGWASIGYSSSSSYNEAAHDSTFK